MPLIVQVLSLLLLTVSSGFAANQTDADPYPIAIKETNGSYIQPNADNGTVIHPNVMNGSLVEPNVSIGSGIEPYVTNGSAVLLNVTIGSVDQQNVSYGSVANGSVANGSVANGSIVQTNVTIGLIIKPNVTNGSVVQSSATNGFPSPANYDREATFMALEKASALLEPPKELFQQIHSDLAVIRSSFANVSDVKYLSNWVPGKLLCNRINERGVQKLNQSEFGPVREDRTEHYTALTFAKSYNTPVLINKLKENGLLEDSYDCRVDGIIDGKSNIIYNYDKTYTFHKSLNDCGLACTDKHYWTFEVKNGTAILIKESET